MIRGYTTVRKGMTWLAAAMTFVTAAPHALCRCVDGTIKPLDFGLSTALAVKDCCAPRDVNQPARRLAPRCPHCPRHQPTSRRPGDSSGCSRSSCCQKATVPAALFTATHSAVRAPTDLGTVAALVPCMRCLAPSPVAPIASVWGERLPPPTDRVITLQHFLI
jgi:hypothetical protein